MIKTIFNRYNLKIYSDVDIRVIRETEKDLDILIPTSDKTINSFTNQLPAFIVDRIQFPLMYGIMLRVAKADDNNIAALHFLKSVDLNSTVANFDIDYSNIEIYISSKEDSISIYIDERK